MLRDAYLGAVEAQAVLREVRRHQPEVHDLILVARSASGLTPKEVALRCLSSLTARVAMEGCSRLTPTALSRALMVTSGGMTKRLAGLERRGLITREPDPADGRSTAVSLTREGSRLVDATLRDHVVNQQRLLDGLERNERAELARLLEKLAASLGDQTERRAARRATRARKLA